MIEAADGTEGLRRAPTRPPDLIVLDLQMPAASDGFRCCAELARTAATRDPGRGRTSLASGREPPPRLARARPFCPKASLSRETVATSVLREAADLPEGRSDMIAGPPPSSYVDDTEAIRYAKTRTLRRAGYHVVEAAHRREASRSLTRCGRRWRCST